MEKLLVIKVYWEDYKKALNKRFKEVNKERLNRPAEALFPKLLKYLEHYAEDEKFVFLSAEETVDDFYNKGQFFIRTTEGEHEWKMTCESVGMGNIWNSKYCCKGF